MICTAGNSTVYNPKKLRMTDLFLIRSWQPLQTDFDAAKKYAGYKAGADVDMLQNNITRFREFTRFRV